jgi:hypothetical protein
MEVEVFPVATDDEVEIIRVQGDYTSSLVVGDPPLRGEMRLAEQGDVHVNYMSPAPGNTASDMSVDTNRPMIWSTPGADAAEPEEY